MTNHLGRALRDSDHFTSEDFAEVHAGIEPFVDDVAQPIVSHQLHIDAWVLPPFNRRIQP